MPDLHFIKASVGLIPADETARTWFDKQRSGAGINAKVSVPRNPKFSRKFFAMLHTAYDNHEWPEIETQYGLARTTFDQFRAYVTVKAGYFTMGATPQGHPRAVPKSIAFANMGEDEFSQLYSDVLDVIIAEFLDNWTTGDMERAVEQMLGFA